MQKVFFLFFIFYAAEYHQLCNNRAMLLGCEMLVYVPGKSLLTPPDSQIKRL